MENKLRYFWKNNKTTVVGFSLAVFTALEPVVAYGEVDWKQVFVGTMVGALGYFAKDNVK